jgi:hypothetical protein
MRFDTRRSGPQKHMRVLSIIVLTFSLAGAALAQDQGVPFKMQTVGDQVVNGVLIHGGQVPVWTDPSGRPAGRPTSSTPDRANQDELNELARIGRPDAQYGGAAPAPAPAPAPAQIQRQQSQPMRAAAAAPQFEVVGDVQSPVPTTRSSVPAAPAAAIHRRARSDDEEVADLQQAVAAAESELRMKQKQIEDRKRDEAHRAEEARIAAEREVARQRLVFQAKAGQMLSEAVSIYVGQNGWENVEWNVSADFKVKFAYSERPGQGEGMKEVLLKVLKAYGLSSENHRPNSVVEVFSANDAANRK